MNEEDQDNKAVHSFAGTEFYRPLTETRPGDTGIIESVLKGAGVNFVHRVFPDEVRDPAQIALRLKAGIRQICRTLVLKGRHTGDGHVVVVTGRNQISLRKLVKAAGEELERPSEEFMREFVGYPDNAVPPFGHRQRLRTYVDRDVMCFHNAWFPAGSARMWMFLRTDTVVDLAGAKVLDLRVEEDKRIQVGGGLPH
jgi:prolyl-tRNA editing enzyme YbaK/EbsC (Cys-tRNA(Pro) deacylase)